MINVVKASAGTGKTYRLSLEYVASLLQGQDFEKIAVMTFTRKATAEIRERIFQHIEDILEKGKESEVWQSLREIYEDISFKKKKLQQSYERMLLHKDRINVYTIDSFVNQIFEKAVAPYLGIYQYEIIEENKNKDIIAEVFRRILDNPDDFKRIEDFLKQNTERNIEVYIDLIKNILNNRWKFLVLEYEERDRHQSGEITVQLNKCLQTLETVAAERGDELDKGYYKKDFRDVLTTYQNYENEKKRRNLLQKYWKMFLKRSFWNGNKLRGNSLAPLKEELAANYEIFRENLARYLFQEEVIPYEEQIYDISQRIIEIYDQIKFTQKIFTHDDISNYTYKYFFSEDLDLTRGQEVTEYFYNLIGARIDSLLIDEFQDTSILQWKIIKPLVNSCRNLVAVGDEKQSIYGWRGGEKKLFSRLEEILNGESETLSTCYRSQAAVLEFINNFFSNIKKDWDYSKVEHLPQKNGGYLEVKVGGAKAKINTNTKAFRRKSQEKQQELQQLNNSISNNLKKDIATSINNNIEDYSEVGILARTNDDLEDIADELDKNNIPYILESQDSLLEHEAVKPLYFLLSYLYSDDYFQLIQFLRSRLVGINNQTLKYMLEHRQEIEEFLEDYSGQQIDKKDAEIRAGIKKILQRIGSLNKLDYRELTDYIVNKSGVLSIFDSPSARKNLYYFFEIIREFETLAELMEYLEENKDSDDLKQAGVKQAEAVNLMTIHKAKGLSFDSEYFYWNPRSRGGGYNQLQLYLEFDREFVEVEDYLLTNSRYNDVIEYMDIDFAEKEEQKQLMEEINNVYVALTRASNNLFFYVESPRQLKNPKKGSYWADSSYQFYEDALVCGSKVESLTDLVSGKSWGQLQQQPEAETVELAQLPDLSNYFAVPEIERSRLIEYNRNKDFSLTSRGNLKRLEGLALHYYLQHIYENTEEERNYARSQVLAKYGNVLSPDRLQQIFARINKFMSDHPQYFSEDWQIFTEYEIKENGKSYRLDRLLVDNGARRIVIIDYKTGEVRDQSQLDKYQELIRERAGQDYQIESEFVEV